MREIIEAIEGHFFTHKETPSITEIARAVGRSRSTVHAYLQEMNKNGQIHYDGVTLETPVTSKADSGYSLSPIIGSIACGEPQYEEENFEAYADMQGHFHARCRKCKWEKPINLAYFRTQNGIWRLKAKYYGEDYLEN